ncbi:MAG TPA: GNAT family N-acetyltransferase [Gemmatimonadaceae bacterium]|jgi:amino-acid N-acetyltransferase|nr:GNAT family N-acetyltransferase [Gemmatimonadaceae bacterium]
MNNVIYRRGRDSDVNNIAVLINGYAAERIMLPKTADAIALSIEDFVVATDRHGRLLGCAALREYAPSLAEVASVAVARTAHGMGIGRHLVERIEDLGAARGITEVFALTLTTGFFESMDYAVVDRARYPEKICRDCVICPRRMACDEICVSKQLHAGVALRRDRKLVA